MTEKKAYTIPEVIASGVAGKRTHIYSAINEGKLKARKVGRRTIVLAEDLDAYIETLPRIEPKKAA